MLNYIKDDFDIDVWEYLHDFGKIGRQQKDLIYLFMEQRGILKDGTCWDAIGAKERPHPIVKANRLTETPDGDP